MARSLANVGTVSYNGFTFPAPFNAEVQAQPIRDTSKRYIKYTRYTITIRSIIVPDDAPQSSPGAAVDENLEDIRCKLEKAGGSFVFAGQGIGRSFAVNVAGSFTSSSGLVNSFKIDPTYGPFPTLLTWRSAGSNRAVEIVWSVEVTIPECCDDLNQTQTGGLWLEHNYSVNWSIGENGATERTITGYFEVPGTRQNPRAGDVSESRIRGNADLLWENVYRKIPLIPGFRRTSNRNLSTDKRQMNYTIRDVEIPSDNPFYPYMVNMEIHHRVSAQNNGNAKAPGNLMTPISTLSGNIEVAPGTPRHWAYLAFSNVAFERFSRAKTLQPTSSGLKGTPQRVLPRAFLLSYSFEEDIYAREFTFEFSWWTLLGKITEVIQGVGLFQPIKTANPNWNSWMISMAAVANSARGLAKLQSYNNEDALIFNCDTGTQPAAISNYAIKTFPFIPQFIQQNLETLPSPGQDYIYANMVVEADLQTNTITHDISEKANKPDMVAPPDPKTTTGVDASKIISSYQSQPRVVQVLSSAKLRVAISGTIVRVGRHPNVPTVTGVGTVKPLLERCISRVTQSGTNSGGIPIFTLTYTLFLILPNNPTGNILDKITTSPPEGMI